MVWLLEKAVCSSENRRTILRSILMRTVRHPNLGTWKHALRDWMIAPRPGAVEYHVLDLQFDGILSFVVALVVGRSGVLELPLEGLRTSQRFEARNIVVGRMIRRASIA